MREQLSDIWDWITSDFHSDPVRFAVEVLCWMDSMACSIIVNSTVPAPPWLWLYPMWISGTLAYAWCAWSRRSFGMLTTFLMIASMDMVGWMKILFG